jgi:hypothetical protein
MSQVHRGAVHSEERGTRPFVVFLQRKFHSAVSSVDDGCRQTGLSRLSVSFPTIGSNIRERMPANSSGLFPPLRLDEQVRRRHEQHSGQRLPPWRLHSPCALVYGVLEQNDARDYENQSSEREHCNTERGGAEF